MLFGLFENVSIEMYSYLLTYKLHIHLFYTYNIQSNWLQHIKDISLQNYIYKSVASNISILKWNLCDISWQLLKQEGKGHRNNEVKQKEAASIMHPKGPWEGTCESSHTDSPESKSVDVFP